MTIMKIKPSGYDAGSWDSGTYPMENAYDDDLATVARCTLRRISGAKKCKYNFTLPELPEGSIINKVNLRLLLKCANSNSTGACYLAIKLNDTELTLKEIHLEFVNDGINYSIPLSEEQYKSLKSLSFVGRYATITFTCYAYIFDMYIELDYTDLNKEMLSDDSEIWIAKGENHIINVNAYPRTSINWTSDKPDIVKLVPTDNGFSCNVIGKKIGSCNITATHSNNSNCTKTFSVNVNEIIEDISYNFNAGIKNIKAMSIGENKIKKIYLGDKKLFTASNPRIPHTNFNFKNITQDLTMNLYTKLTPEKYINGILCRVSTYIDAAGHLAGALRTTNDSSGITGDDSSATYDFIPVFPGEDIIIDIPTTKYGIGLVGYGETKDYYQTWFGPANGWANYNKYTDADIEKYNNMTCTIPAEGVNYIRWCMDSFDTDKYYFRRYSAQTIDAIAYPLNSTEDNEIHYESLDESIAVIENNNRIRAKSAGSCIIKVTCGTITTNINLTINDNSSDFVTYTNQADGGDNNSTEETPQ